MAECRPVKKFNQTKIHAYYSVQSVVSKQDLVVKGTTKSTRRSFPSGALSTMSHGSDSSDHAQCVKKIPKRKLPAPIFSDDEDSDFSSSQKSVLTNFSKGSVRSKQVLTSLNRAGKCRKTIPDSKPPSITSQNSNESSYAIPSSSKQDYPNDNNKNKSAREVSNKKITVLDNIRIRPLSKQTDGSATDEDSAVDFNKKDSKKVNYEYLKVLREFFVNVLNNKYLKNLLNDSDREFLGRFFNIERNWQYLCVKLFLWKPIWYNVFQYVDKIGLKMEDSEITEMYKHLEDNRFVDTDYMTEDTVVLLSLLSLREVRDIARSFKFSTVAGAKEHLIGRLLKLVKTQATLSSLKNIEQILRERIKEKMGVCVKLSSDLARGLYYVFLLNTFTNPSLIVPQDYFTNVRYFSVVFPVCQLENFHIFYTPQEFSRYADAAKLRCELEKCIESRETSLVFEICMHAFNRLKELGDFHDSSREPHLERFTANAQYVGIVSSGAKHITTSHFNEVKVWLEYLITQKYCSHRRGEWYNHLVLIYTVYLKEYQRAATLVIQALEQDSEDITEIQLHDLAHRAKVLNRKTYCLPTLLRDQIALLIPASCDRSWPQDVVNCKSNPSNEPGRRRTYIHHGGCGEVNYLNVEQTALMYYENLGYPNGEHCEGSLIVASFCLLFWDVIYEKFVKGTFTSKVQNAPLDMYTKYFFINREASITERLKSIENKWTEEQFKKKLFDNYNLHSHEKSLCSVDSVVQDPQYLYSMLVCISRPILSKIFYKLAKNFKVYHSGFPDLIVWNVEEKKAKFVEVKSENDILSTKQKLWLNYLMDIGASVAVCRVESKASRRKML